MEIIIKEDQAYGAFNGGQIIENKPIGFPQDGGKGKPHSALFYWAYAKAMEDSTIGLHPHRGFEIMSFVLNGNIRHFDTKLNAWQELSKGDAQIIRAGNGISHSEFMAKDAVMFQIWMDPNLNKTMEQEASYNDYTDAEFKRIEGNGITRKIYVGQDGLMRMDTPFVKIEEWTINEGQFKYTTSSDSYFSAYNLGEPFSINGKDFPSDAYLRIAQATDILIESDGEAKMFIIECPKKLAYKTYSELMQEKMQ
jgi:redox-sensitive bicupin YhaK (pirin superfamily)